MIIPFASQMSPRTYANNGNPTTLTLLGFGYFDSTDSSIAIPDMSVALESDGSFNIGTTSNRRRHLVFSVPFNVKIISIYASVGNALQFTPSGSVFPFVQLYTANANSNIFTPITGAVAEPETALGPGTVQEATTLSAFVDGLNIELPAGTRVAIGGLMRIEGDSAPRDYYLQYTGGIGLSRA